MPREIFPVGRIPRSGYSNVRVVFENSLSTIFGMEKSLQNVTLPFSFTDALMSHKRIMAADAEIFHRKTFRSFPKSYGPVISSIILDGQRVSPEQYQKDIALRSILRREICGMLQDGVIFLSPATPSTAPGMETTGDPIFNSLWSFLGCPTITIPCGFDANIGLPCGMQLISHPDAEDVLLNAAEFCESKISFNRDLAELI
mmetsp:Transcript_24058/g.27717  ORF Transcript_24058/g.27717 Transcript_24058/m.27717 type:complete len:201 (-) Transcript_24058:54-656(-)